MMEAVTSTEQSLAGTPQQANLIALRIEAQNQQAIADLLARQADKQAEQVSPPANPEGIGENVDTYA
jgi:hypothetical protein